MPKMRIGEDELIDRIRRRIPSSPGGAVRVGIGDDAAVIKARPGTEWVFSCDQFLENVHFLAAAHPPEAIGYKALARAVSDLGAMGARPRFFLLCLVAALSAHRNVARRNDTRDVTRSAAVRANAGGRGHRQEPFQQSGRSVESHGGWRDCRGARRGSGRRAAWRRHFCEWPPRRIPTRTRIDFARHGAKGAMAEAARAALLSQTCR